MTANPIPDSDNALLVKYARQADEVAFEALVRRHTPLVMGVCRRVLGNTSDAEDIAQLVFILLSEKAGELSEHPCLDGWLHRAARQVALRHQQSAGRRRRREASAAVPIVDLSTHGDDRENVRRLLDRELDALPDRYRQPLILHYLQGKSQEEAAGILGWSYGTMSGRLNRARSLLKQRLERHGAIISIGALSMVCADSMAGIPPTFATSVLYAMKNGIAFSSAGLGSAASVKTAAAAWSAKAVAAALLGVTALTGAWVSLRPAAVVSPDPPPAAIEPETAPVPRTGSAIIRYPGYTLWPRRGTLLRDGSVIVLAQRSLEFDVPNSQIEAGLLRCDANGAFDQTFGSEGWAALEGGCFAYSVDAQKSGGIIAAAASSAGQDRVRVFRFDGHGQIDRSFGDGGVLERDIDPDVNEGGNTAIVVDGRDRILLMRQRGEATHLDRFDPQGRTDPTFGDGGEVVIAIGESREGLSLAVDRGTIVVAGAVGRVTAASGVADLFVARYRENGAPDSAFGNDGVAIRQIGAGGPRGARVIPGIDGSLTIYGQYVRGFDAAEPNPREVDDAYVLRCRADGGVGYLSAASHADERRVAFCAVPQDDGTVVLGVAPRTEIPLEGSGMIMARHGILMRLDAGGIPDSAFGDNGTVRCPGDWAFDLMRRANGGLVCVGVDFEDPDAMPIIVSQWLRDGSPDPDFGEIAGTSDF